MPAGTVEFCDPGTMNSLTFSRGFFALMKQIQ
jgi:hypothetical protein